MSTVTRSLSVYPSFYDTTNHVYTSLTNPENAYTSHTSTTYAQMNDTRYTDNYVYFGFDVSSIPLDATINSVSCIVKIQSSGSGVSRRVLQLYSGADAKGSARTFSNNKTSTVTLTVNTWTRNELNNIRLYIHAYAGNSSGYYQRIYGATLTVNYSYEVAGPTVFLKQNGSWVQAESVFYKQNGTWVNVESMGVKDDGTWKS